MTERPRNLGVKLAIDRAGSAAALARALGLAQSAVSMWTRVPEHHVNKIARLYNIPRHQLRPDLYAAKSTHLGRPRRAPRAEPEGI